MTLSVLVPSYNAASFVPRFEELFYEPSLEGEVEFLLIDDGAKDNTLELIRNLEARHPYYFRAFHKENGGHGSVINFGLERCRGVFFKVIDGDDAIDKSALVQFVSFLKKCAADLVVSDFDRVFVGENGREERVYCFAREGVAKANLIQGQPFLQLHSMTFATSLWRQNGLAVREHVFYEDQEYCLYPLPYVQKIDYFEGSTYRYSIGVAGQSISIESVRKHAKDHAICMDDLLDYYEKFRGKAFPYYELWVAFLGFAARNHFENIMLVSSRKELRRSLRAFKHKVQQYPEIWERAKRWNIVSSLNLCHGLFAPLVRSIKTKKTHL